MYNWSNNDSNSFGCIFASIAMGAGVVKALAIFGIAIVAATMIVGGAVLIFK